MGLTAVDDYADFVIQTRPEIRKGCVWDISLLFSLEALTKHKLKEIYLEKPRVQRESGAYLCLKVRSKLIQKEIGFGKVGELEHDRPFIEPNLSTGCATLKVKFMQRPRAVFHRHADVMVLVVSLRSCMSNEVLMTAEHELIFRGGTGSMHSAERKKAALPFPTASSYLIDSSSTSYAHDTPSNAHHTSSYTASASHGHSVSQKMPNNASPSPASHSVPLLPPLAPSFAKPTAEHFALSEAVTRAHPHAAKRCVAAKRVATPFPPVQQARPLEECGIGPNNYFLPPSGTFLLDNLSGDIPENAPHMEVQPLTIDTIQEFQAELRDQCNAENDNDPTDSLEFGSSPSATFADEAPGTDLDDALELEAWAKSSGFDTSLFASSEASSSLEPQSNSLLNNGYSQTSLAEHSLYSEISFAPAPLSTPHPSIPQHIIEQHAHKHSSTSSARSGSSIKSDVEDSSLASNEPSVAGAVTRARSAKMAGGYASKKRRAEYDPDMAFMGPSKMMYRGGMRGDLVSQSSLNMNSDPSAIHAAMMQQHMSFEDKVFQKLFFRSLAFLSLEELRALAQTAPLPIFVKDEQGVYLLANPAFCSFVYDENWDSIVHRSAHQLLDAQESERITRADQYIMQREGNVGTFTLSIKQQDYRVMKLYTKLRDCDTKLVVGAVTF